MRARNRDRQSSEIQALNEYWDDVVRLAPTTPVPPAATPSDLTSLVRHLHSAEDADQHRPPYEDRLLHRLLDTQQETTTMSATALAPIHTSWLPQRRSGPAMPPPKPFRADRSKGIPWIPVLVSAALVLLAL